MEKVKLKSCPFCGDHDVQLQYVGNLSNQVICLACGSRGPSDGYNEAIERWNLRAVAHNELPDDYQEPVVITCERCGRKTSHPEGWHYCGAKADQHG
ncbi:Lar family restriction alleviation protein [Serratia liquefaciens]|uniref:Lar family restriction alleviation protein n=1 Tax=Serratia liquefaciens TaxID=614 RepID=UPI0021B7BC83|nr:Lar family restriction alleviation protein [Serratia liquefaciens]